MHSPVSYLNLAHLRALTIENGEDWAYPHVSRVLRLVQEIGAGMTYDEDVILYAAYLHDWGAFPCYRQAGVEHALRSVQIAETNILPNTNLSPTTQQAILNAIALHDYRDERSATGEALLLREADMLDMLGVIGILREFAWGPFNLKTCYERVQSRHIVIADRLTLPRAQVIAAHRIESMEHTLNHLMEESFGIL
jgi:uncharacterized protein